MSVESGKAPGAVNMFVNTTTREDGKIETITGVEQDGVRELIQRQVLDTQHRQVNEALVKLGWTPPPKNPASKIMVDGAVQQLRAELGQARGDIQRYATAMHGLTELLEQLSTALPGEQGAAVRKTYESVMEAAGFEPRVPS